MFLHFSLVYRQSLKVQTIVSTRIIVYRFLSVKSLNLLFQQFLEIGENRREAVFFLKSKFYFLYAFQRKKKT